jgi:hypothetical protein
MKIKVKDAALRQAAEAGMDDFLQVVVNAFQDEVGHELTAETMTKLSGEQITLWAYILLRDELCDGGFIQLIHNGYGDFFFLNPFAKAMRLWGLKELSKLIYKGRELYELHGKEIKKPCSDEEFMGLYERFPEFDDLDDEFMEHEEEYTTRVAQYLDEHLLDFIEIDNYE